MNNILISYPVYQDLKSSITSIATKDFIQLIKSGTKYITEIEGIFHTIEVNKDGELVVIK
jgi:hypothetical protein